MPAPVEDTRRGPTTPRQRDSQPQKALQADDMGRYGSISFTVTKRQHSPSSDNITVLPHTNITAKSFHELKNAYQKHPTAQMYFLSYFLPLR